MQDSRCTPTIIMCTYESTRERVSHTIYHTLFINVNNGNDNNFEKSCHEGLNSELSTVIKSGDRMMGM